MNPFRPTKIEWITLVSFMPPVVGILYYFMFGDRPLVTRHLLEGIAVITLIIFMSWYLHVLSMHYLHVKMPHVTQTLLRLGTLAVVHLSLNSLSIVLVFYGFDAIHFLGYTFNKHYFHLSLVLGTTLILIASSIWEGEFVFAKWKASLAEKELLEQLSLQHEFESLKNQVNPHFLFNCFNTLSSLIAEDPARAETFLDELSKVYRYLLRNNEDGLTTLKSELAFIQSYFALLKSRYGQGVDMKIEIDRKYETYLLPSLSLQLLVENAVKHNVVSKQTPLVVDIFTTAGNKLIVNNNLQPKLIKAQSNKVGLENIRSKYMLLEQAGFQVLEDDKNFTVVLPLLWNKFSDNKTAITANFLKQ